MAAVIRNGPPPESRPFDMKVDKEFRAWEEAWASYLGQQAPTEVLVSPAQRPGANRPADPERQARHAEAVAFIGGYSGTFGLILDLRADRRWGTKHFRLSDRQIEVVLACKARELVRSKERKQTGRDLTVLPVGRTAAAVDNESGGLTFLLIDRPGEKDRYGQPNRWFGWVFVKQQQGADEIRLGSQRPGESYSGQWANLVDKVLADPMAAVARYGIELGVCGVCMSPLTNAESRANGIGPVCSEKIAGGLE